MHPYQPHKITRSRVVVGLMITAMLASCAAPTANREPTRTVSTGGSGAVPIPPPPATTAQTNTAAEAAKAGKEEIRFKDVASCKTETERLQAEYKTLKASFDAGKQNGTAPKEPTLKPEECEAFIASAKQQYAAQTPTYADNASCEASGTQCERVNPGPNNNYVQPVYRPIFYGSYGYNPWVSPIYIGGRRDYGQQTVIIERDSGRNTTSVGSGSSGGRTSSSTSNSTSRPTSTTSTTSTTPSRTTSKTTSKTTRPGSIRTPSKPSSTSGKGAIGGRGSSGFGSSYGYSGKGGK